jgi:hypothetical protein
MPAVAVCSPEYRDHTISVACMALKYIDVVTHASTLWVGRFAHVAVLLLRYVGCARTRPHQSRRSMQDLPQQPGCTAASQCQVPQNAGSPCAEVARTLWQRGALGATQRGLCWWPCPGVIRAMPAHSAALNRAFKYVFNEQSSSRVQHHVDPQCRVISLSRQHVAASYMQLCCFGRQPFNTPHTTCADMHAQLISRPGQHAHSRSLRACSARLMLTAAAPRMCALQAGAFEQPAAFQLRGGPLAEMTAGINVQASTSGAPHSGQKQPAPPSPGPSRTGDLQQQAAWRGPRAHRKDEQHGSWGQGAGLPGPPPCTHGLLGARGELSAPWGNRAPALAEYQREVARKGANRAGAVGRAGQGITTELDLSNFRGRCSARGPWHTGAASTLRGGRVEQGQALES